MSNVAALGLGLNVETTSKLYLKHPVTAEPIVCKDGKPSWIELRYGESEIGRKTQRLAMDANIHRAVRKVTPNSEQIDAQVLSRLAALTVSWRLVNIETGEEIAAETFPCNEVNARALYKEPSTSWIRKQVDEIVENEAAFFRK